MGIPNTLFVTEQTPQGPLQMNLYSRLLDGQIIFLNGEINDDMAEIIIAPTSLFRIKRIRKHIQTILNEEIYAKQIIQ